MHREWIDRSADATGRLQAWDPRLKVAATFACLLAITLGAASPGEESWLRLAFITCALGAAALHARLRLGSWLARSFVVLPFAAFVAAGKLVAITAGGSPGVSLGDWTIGAAPGGGEEALRLLGRAWLSILATLLLAMTTPFPAVLAALDRARVPRGFLGACALVHRYLWVLVGEGRRLLLARRLRSGRVAPWRSGGRILATLFARSLGRAGRIEMAMRLRGHPGALPLGRRLAWTAADTRRLLLIAAALAAAILAPELGGRSG